MGLRHAAEHHGVGGGRGGDDWKCYPIGLLEGGVQQSDFLICSLEVSSSHHSLRTTSIVADK